MAEVGLLLAVLWSPTFLNSWFMGFLQEKKKRTTTSHDNIKEEEPRKTGRILRRLGGILGSSTTLRTSSIVCNC